MTQVSGYSIVAATQAVLGQNVAGSSSIGTESQAYTCFKATPNVAGGYGGYASDNGYTNFWGWYANVSASGGVGVYVSASGSATYGVYTACSNSNGYALYAYDGSGSSYAGYFHGNIYCTGTVTCGDVNNNRIYCSEVHKGVCYFSIDHPLDPENKILMHASVESDAPKTFYNGEVVLDASGCAEVVFPDWFNALNISCHVNASPVGQKMPDLYLSKCENGKFSIYGGAPNGEVYWMLAATRKDAHVQHAPMKVESLKSDKEKGKYLNPTAFGFGPEMNARIPNATPPSTPNK